MPRPAGLIAASLSAFFLLVPQAYSENARQLPQSQAEVQLSFAPLVKQTAPSVVNVYAERMVQRRSIFDDDPFFSQLFGGRAPGRTEKQSSLGSGVIASTDGYIITNNHVIEGADEVKVALADGREYPAKIVLKDDRVDLAVLKVDTDDSLPPLPIGDSDDIEVGDLALAIGNPFGVGQTVTNGIVSGLARTGVGVSDFGFFIQTDASINPGNSGGALIDMRGELIGINSAIFSRSGGSNGIGFAIPSNLARVFLAAAERGDKSFERPYIGAEFSTLTADMAEALGLEHAGGAFVTSVAEDSPAAEAGLQQGDAVVAMNGHPVEHPDALGYRLLTAGLGTTADLTVMRDGKAREVTISLERAPETVPRDQRVLEGRNPLSGAEVANLSPRVAQELRMGNKLNGVVVVDVQRGSPAGRVGFQPRDIIVSLNGVEVSNTQMLQSLLDENANGWRVVIDRDGQRIRQLFR
ncbi:DegQ family serine endoprotease [Rhizobium sp. L1K21]|uniref:DegQ family serine endoprotease n=1 Tax=Rhizobium sp. L1K21 TaxID=2954933 RepID=UPI002093BE64|nr:DegQ family serine endoprotease [Rhizobium sp. L1K21]MCO6186364.1 DegQ family serine endoprotease [Rhizobium sp. L1K21]